MYRNDVKYIRIAHVSIYWPAASTASRRRSLVGCSVRGHNKGDHSTVPRGFNIYIKQFRTLVWTLRSDAGIDASAKSLSLYLHTYFGWRSRSGVSDAITLQRTRMYFKKDQCHRNSILHATLPTVQRWRIPVVSCRSLKLRTPTCQAGVLRHLGWGGGKGRGTEKKNCYKWTLA